MSMSLDDLKAMFTGLGDEDGLLNAALAYSEDRVRRVYGPRYDPARPMMEATWRRIDWQPWPVTLQFLHPVETIHSLTINDDPKVDDDYALDYDTGQITVRDIFVYSTTGVCRYTPQDKRGLRDAVQGEVAAMYLARTRRALPTGSQQDPRDWRFDPLRQEDLALNRLATLIGPHLNLPQRTVYV